MKKVMVRAWEIAREAAAKFGGRAIEYIAGALKMAWAEIKKPKFITVRVIYGWKSCYVAKIVGTHPRYKLDRQFLREDEKERSYSGKTGYNIYHIQDNGVYEKSSSGKKEYFVIENGVKKEIEYSDVLKLVG